MEMRSVGYGFNSTLPEPFFLDVVVEKEGVTLVDLHKNLKTKEEFDEAVEDATIEVEEVLETQEDCRYLEEYEELEEV